MFGMRLWKRGDIWYITIRRGKHKSLRTKNEALARKIFKEYQERLLKKKLHEINSKGLKLLHDFKDEYLDVRKKTVKHSTYRADRYALEKFIDFYGNRPMASLNVKKLTEFKAYLADSGMKHTSCNIIIRHLKKALKTAIKWGYIDKNLELDELNQFKIDQRKYTFLSIEEINRLLEAASEYKRPFMKTAIAIMLYTGMSRAEITSTINIEDDYIGYKRVKTGKYIRVPIADELRDYIKYLPKGLQKIVPWKSKDTFSKHFRAIAEKAEVEASPHKIRHTFASLLINNGVDIKIIKELMGHSSIYVTDMFYAHLLEEKKVEAINKLTLKEKKRQIA